MSTFKNDSAIVNDEELYNKKITTVPAPSPKNDIDVSNSFYTNIIDAGMNSVLDMSAFQTLGNVAQSRNELYNIYDSMCQDGTISAVLETYAEDITERNDDGKIVWVQSDNPEVGKMVEYLLDTLNVDKHIYKWAYTLCKYGDLYLRLYRESEFSDELFLAKDRKLNEDVKINAYSKNDNYAHYMEMVANPAEMFEVTKFGKTIGYIHAPVTNTLQQGDPTMLSTFSYKFKKEDIQVYPATEFVHAALEDNNSRVEEVINIFTNADDYNSNENAKTYKVNRGQSLLADLFKTWRELSLLETSVLLYRLTKSSRVRVVNVEVGDMPKENINKTLLGIKRMIEQKAAINAGSSMSEYTNPGPIENTIYVPTHEGKGSITTSEIGGEVDVKSLADLDYYTNKLYGQLRVPKQYFAQTDDSTGFNGGTSLAIISSRYAKMIKRVQTTLIQALTDAINLMLIDKNLDSYVNDFSIHMLPPTTQEEIDRRESMSGKVQLASDIMNMLADIEDPVTKLKMLKALLSDIVSDSELISLLDEYIEAAEDEGSETSEEPVDEGEPGGGENFGGGDFGGDDFGGEFGSEEDSYDDTDMGDEVDAALGIEDDSEGETPEEEILPNGDDLGVDLTDSE